MLIDTHAHINFRDYKDDGDEVIKKALENDVWMINVGAELDTSERAVEYAMRYPVGVFAAVGLHPFHLRKQKIKEEGVEFEVEGEEFNEQKYKNLSQNPKTVAVGEIGLDYAVFARERRERLQKRASAEANEAESEGGLQNELEVKEKQKEIFKKQIELALDLDKPIIVHCRNAHNDVIEILKPYTLNNKANLRGVIHSFSGNYKQARQYREMGFKIAFNGIITFARDYDKAILDTPLEDILLETDCPYLAPVPYRGQRNEPLYVIGVAKKLAEIKNTSFEEIANQTTANALNVFRLHLP